jgi:hypothetical protein
VHVSADPESKFVQEEFLGDNKVQLRGIRMVPQSTRNTDVLLHKFEVQKLKEEIQGLKIELDLLKKVD